MGDKAQSEGAGSSQVGSEIEINIKTLDSQIYTFRVDKSMPIPMLKERIADVIGTSVGQQRLIYRGKVLKDDHCLSEYQLEDGHTLHLVERQPVQAQHTSGTSSQENTRSNVNQGHGSTAPPPPNRVGQISHSVVLGTVNLADQGETMAADISRLVGSVLNSLGVAANNISTAATSNQVPASAETGAHNANGGTQAANLGRPGFPILNHAIQFVPQISQSPLVSLSRSTVIPDSLTTLSEFINRMDLALQSAGSQSSSSSTNVGELPRSDIPFPNQRGLPTPEMLGSTIERAQQLLSGSATTTLSQIVARLESDGTSTDPTVRSQIQTEAMYVGAAMQHLGALFLELGRTTMALHMGQSPAESWVNAGPAVYISSTGPNPIMVQPFPLQTSSIFSTTPIVPQVSGPFGTVDPSRNVNIHIHTGTSVASGVSSAGPGASRGDASHGESLNMEQASTNGNSSGDAASTGGLPSRIVVATTPARSAAESRGHVLSVFLPVQVRSQQSIPGLPGSSAHGSNVTASSGAQPNVPIPAPNSSESVTVPTLVAHINSRIASALSGNTLGRSSTSPSTQPTDSEGAHLTTGSRAQTNTASQPQEISSGVNTIAIPGTVQGQSSLSNVPSTYTSRAREETEVTASGLLSHGFANSVGSSHVQSIDDAGVCESRRCSDIGFPETEGQQLQSEAPQNSSSWGSSISSSEETSASSTGVTTCQAGDRASGISMDVTFEKNSPFLTDRTTEPDQGLMDGDRPAPLGLGLGGLQPKRRGKIEKPTTNIDGSDNKPSISQNKQSIARGQHVRESLVSQRTDMNRASANASASILPELEQIDIPDLMSQILQSPSINSYLTGVAEDTGMDSPSNLRNMIMQFTRSPSINNVLNNIAQLVEGRGQDIESMMSGRGIDVSSTLENVTPLVSQALGRGSTHSAPVRASDPRLSETSDSRSRGIGRGQGTIDISTMLQQVMPVVSQVLGSGAMHSSNDRNGGSHPLPQGSSDIKADGHDMLNICNAQVNLHQVVERIEREDSPAHIFRAELESAAQLDSEENDYSDLVEELGNNAELVDEFGELLRNHIQQKLEGESKSRV